jgi:hypothetical protein
MTFHWGSDLFGRVDAAKGVFSVSTQFLAGNGIPFLPERSILRARVGRRYLNYPIPLNWKSVLVVYARVLSLMLALAAVTGFAAMLDRTGKVSHFYCIVVAVSCGVAAASLFGLTHLPRVKSAGYHRAVRLALEAKVHDVVLADLQKAYGKTPDCAIIHGFPVSSTRVLYAYAESEDQQRIASQLERKLRRLANRHRRALDEVWVVNAIQSEDNSERELGLIVILPPAPPAPTQSWLREIESLILHLGQLHQGTGANFAIGIYDTRTQSNRDLFSVDSPQPSLIRLRATLSSLQQLLSAPALKH